MIAMPARIDPAPGSQARSPAVDWLCLKPDPGYMQ